ncbi:MAG: hypothetical protein ABI051_14980 [Vicinamibacterales bacterium]
MRHGYTLATVVALALGASTLVAAERATFILTNGERVSGTVVFHTEERTNIRADKNEFNLKVTDGTEMPIPFGQVAVIDFIGGQPRTDELDALPTSGHLLTLRDGNMRRGRLVDLIGGDTVRWEQATGGRVDIPISDVRRIYLDVGRARDLFEGRGGRNRGVARGVGASPATPAVQDPRVLRRGGLGTQGAPAAAANSSQEVVTVRGNVPWMDTGITVRTGESIRFTTTGRVFFSAANDAAAEADGNGNFRNKDFPVADVPAGALIGKIGANGPAFPIGSAPELLRMGNPGRLYLGVNDTIFDDNSGAFRVTVTRNAR